MKKLSGFTFSSTALENDNVDVGGRYKKEIEIVISHHCKEEKVKDLLRGA